MTRAQIPVRESPPGSAGPPGPGLRVRHRRHGADVRPPDPDGRAVSRLQAGVDGMGGRRPQADHPGFRRLHARPELRLRSVPLQDGHAGRAGGGGVRSALRRDEPDAAGPRGAAGVPRRGGMGEGRAEASQRTGRRERLRGLGRELVRPAGRAERAEGHGVCAGLRALRSRPDHLRRVRQRPEPRGRLRPDGHSRARAGVRSRQPAVRGAPRGLRPHHPDVAGSARGGAWPDVYVSAHPAVEPRIHRAP